MGKNTFQWVCLVSSETDWNGLGKETCDLDIFTGSQKHWTVLRKNAF